MKNLTIPLFVFLILASTASGLMLPMPVSLKINNEGSLSGYNIEMQNMRTGEVVTMLTDGNGFAIFDWSNSEFGWMVGDIIVTTVLDCSSDPECVVANTIDSKGTPIYFLIDLTDVVCPGCPSCPTDNTPYADCNSCCPNVVCQDCPDVNCNCPDPVVCEECQVCDECPASDDIFGWMMGLLGAILGIAGGSLTVFYKNKITGRWKKLTTERVEDGTAKREAN